MIKFFKSMFSETPDVSCLRFISTLVIVTILLNWTYYNIVNGVLAPLDLNSLITILGLLIVKVAQKKMEK